MHTLLKYFKGSFALTLIGLVLGYWIGESTGIGGAKAAFIVLILSILETSLSFDNAVVNATVLKDMDPVWRRRFMTWGMLIAVFGMRVVFPVLIVAIIAWVSPWEALVMAVSRPEDYAHTLTSAHITVAGFGGSFLMMVFFKFFLDKEKDVHWVKLIERPLTKIGKMEAAEIALTLILSYTLSRFLPAHEQLPFLVSCIAGLVTYVVVDGFASLLGSDEKEAHHGTVQVAARTGFASFMYLEVLDASFSFDGVIGAFALSNNIFIIAIGLGVGAMFVRSMTLMLVEKETLEQFRYLEHGAFWAIGALATIMYLNTVMHISEVITGLIGAGFIALALWSSIRYNKKNA